MNDFEKSERKKLLEPEKMLFLYSRGAFPMANDSGEIEWYMPDIRTIIPLKNFNFPRSLKKFMSYSNFQFKYDYDPLTIIRNCASREETWISEELIEAYKGLIERENLHSVEVYWQNELVGGLYGISNKGAFFGESMFSKVSQASKCALVKLIERLNERGYVLLDVQFQTEHLKMFGSKEIPFEEFIDLLRIAEEADVTFT
ncbi:MAG: leucyl/phenylalanyl-tRNA--protein transferase [Melioribacteraceae bacterium]|jgi:leucyl/phenylalanyl-tRNA--protein transferase|nr:leucyl/phenylalanyl-tRNA--protein transferase [Melioribacteraceae bacterium]